MILDCRSESTFPGFFVGFGRISENAVCQGQLSCRTPGKSQKSDLPGSSTPNHPWQRPKNAICQGRTRPFHPWQSAKNTISQGRTRQHQIRFTRVTHTPSTPHRLSIPDKLLKIPLSNIAHRTPGKVQKTRFARVNHHKNTPHPHHQTRSKMAFAIAE